MKSKIKIMIIMTMITLFGNLLFTTGSFATNVGFSIDAVLPENQIDKNITYFNLGMEPKKKQTISVDVYNSIDVEAEFQIDITNATTNSNGLVTYDELDKEKDESLKYGLKDIAKFSDGGETTKKIKIGPVTKKTINIDIEMPDDEYDGIILGGFRVEKTGSGDKVVKDGVMLENKYAYVVGIRLSENDNKVDPNLELVKINTQRKTKLSGIEAVIRNDRTRIISGLEMFGEVYRKGSKKPMKRSDMSDVSFAPNSTMDYVVSWDGEELTPGKYVFKGEAKNDEGVWKFEKEFEIKPEDAKKANDEAIDLEKKFNYWYLIVLLLIIIITALVLYIRKMKKESESIKLSANIEENNQVEQDVNQEKKE